jgi:hypothetical protein
VRVSLPVRIFFWGLLVLVAISMATAFAAGISVPPVNVGRISLSVTAEDIRPSACAGLGLTQIVTGAGTFAGTAGNDLILGSSGADVIDGGGGNDCILGGGGDDSIDGADGSDICLGGPGTDTFANCEGEVQ